MLASSWVWQKYIDVDPEVHMAVARTPSETNNKILQYAMVIRNSVAERGTCSSFHDGEHGKAKREGGRVRRNVLYYSKVPSDGPNVSFELLDERRRNYQRFQTPTVESLIRTRACRPTEGSR